MRKYSSGPAARNHHKLTQPGSFTNQHFGHALEPQQQLAHLFGVLWTLGQAVHCGPVVEDCANEEHGGLYQEGSVVAIFEIAGFVIRSVTLSNPSTSFSRWHSANLVAPLVERVQDHCTVAVGKTKNCNSTVFGQLPKYTAPF
jgi:hypothetical protein